MAVQAPQAGQSPVTFGSLLETFKNGKNWRGSVPADVLNKIFINALRLTKTSSTSEKPCSDELLLYSHLSGKLDKTDKTLADMQSLFERVERSTRPLLQAAPQELKNLLIQPCSLNTNI